jgi:hypothetical protein
MEEIVSFSKSALSVTDPQFTVKGFKRFHEVSSGDASQKLKSAG